MPIHDWSRVEAGIFHDFHHAWIEELKRALNRVLPEDYYALAEQITTRFGPDVLMLQFSDPDGGNGSAAKVGQDASGAVALAGPDIAVTVETDVDYYRLKQKAIAIRHVSDDHVVAVVEIVSKANKANAAGMEAFIKKTTTLLCDDVHLLVLDLQPPTNRDPNGIHGVIWEYISGDDDYQAPKNKPLTLAAYEVAETTRAYVEPVAVGDTLRDMPVFLQPGGQVPAPLEESYLSAYSFVPKRFQRILEAAT